MGILRTWPLVAALVNGVSVCSTRMCTWRQMKRRPLLRIIAPGSSPASQRIWKPLHTPRTMPPLLANFSMDFITGVKRVVVAIGPGENDDSKFHVAPAPCGIAGALILAHACVSGGSY